MGHNSSKADESTSSINLCFDEHGVLIDMTEKMGYKPKSLRVKYKELREIMETEDNEDLDEEEVSWYVMDAAWIRSWFAYVHHESDNLKEDTAPNPGPCRNERLLHPDFESRTWLPRERLVMASKKRGGDYRRVSRKTWERFREIYPRSGPTITTIFKKDDSLDGLYGTSTWEVDQDDEIMGEQMARLKKLTGYVEPSGHKKRVVEVEREPMEDKKITRAITEKMDFLGTRRIADEDNKKKKNKKRGSKS